MTDAGGASMGDLTMMTAEQLTDLCRGIRRRGAASGPPPGSPEVDGALVDRLEADVREYRSAYYHKPVPQLPPEPLRELLPLMGWLVYEASLDRLWDVKPRSGVSPDGEDDESMAAATLVRRLANLARMLVWPEYAPRALGAIRAQALVESKRDDEAGYDAAWIYHREAEQKYRIYLDTLGQGRERARAVLDLDEVRLQLDLAATGTACRTAERVIGRWDQDFEPLYGSRSKDEQARWTQKMFDQLIDGFETGRRAVAAGERIREEHGLAHQVSEKRLILVTGLRNPAIMTCRALLLAYSLCPAMDDAGRTPVGAQTWADYQAELLGQFNEPFTALCRPVQKPDGADWPLNKDHRRSLVQLCLYLGLVTPRHELPCPVVVDDSLTLHVLDDDAVEAMSAWLAAEVDGGQRGDANTIGTASMPAFVKAVEACRHDPGAASDYRKWRLRWPQLDRYAAEPGRAERITEILRETA
ncbi:hypothetical protein [Cryptosporangium phraense]|uniref:Uncharacterized protein n=1 Tax=Cryptosporangium phraense TaxID=2593070 RepID=A0A545AG98_9ACTN|nr:hypothetical protein [Cryptosporangium phraense]TQS40358.1 hypothetical protein FL583_35080 [Cryptosporangium phraense]